ncbi:MAG: CU044_5270 family protein [Actinomycetota bacterium]
MTLDVMELLRRSDPVDPVGIEGWARGEEGRRVLLQIVETSSPVRPPLSRRRRLAVIPAGAGALALALIVGSMLLPAGRGTISAEAAVVLRSAARVAGAQPPVPSDGRYRYTRSEDAYLGTYVERGGSFSVLLPQRREIWVAPDGSGRLREDESGEPIFLGPRDRSTWEASGRPALEESGPSDQTFQPGGLYYADLTGYSTDPDELYGQIQRRAEGPKTSGEPVPEGAPAAVKMFTIVGDLLRETAAPPELRAALYEVAARIPGVILVGEVTDPVGRPGMAVAMASEADGVRRELVFDPETSELLAERQVLLRRVRWVDAAPGTVIGWAAYLKSGTVDSTSARPS